MVLRILILLFPLLAFSSKLSAQIEKKDGKFHYHNQKYSKKSLKDVFSEDEKALKAYNQYQASNKAANILGISSLAAMGTAGLSLIDISECQDGLCYSKLYIFLFSGLVACLTGTAALIFKARSILKFKKALNLFNQNESQNLGQHHDLLKNTPKTPISFGVSYSF